MRVKKPIEIKCMDCGVTFIAYSDKALRCPECKKTHNRENSRVYMQQLREQQKPQAKKRVPKKNALSLDQVLHIAEIYRRINGKYIHYGEMVNLIESNAEHCVCCGATIPEGRQVCYECEMEAKK